MKAMICMTLGGVAAITSAQTSPLQVHDAPGREPRSAVATGSELMAIGKA